MLHNRRFLSVGIVYSVSVVLEIQALALLEAAKCVCNCGVSHYRALTEQALGM